MSKKNKGTKKRFPWGKFFAWKSSDISAAGINIIVTTYLTIYCTNYLGLSGTLVGTVLLVSNMIDAVTDLIAGFVIDSTPLTKFGKVRPYELCILGMTICTWLMFSGPTGASQAVKVAWLFCMYTFIFGVFNTLRGAAQTPYMLRGFDNDRETIGKVASYGGLVTTIGSMVVSISFPIAMSVIATSAAGWSRLVLIYIVPLTVLGIFRFLFVKENPEIDAGQQAQKLSLRDVLHVFTKNKYVWFYAGMILIFNTITNMSVSTYYFTYIVGNTAIMSVLSIMSIIILPFMLLMPVLMKKFTVAQIITGGAVIGIGGYLVAFAAGSNITLLMVAGFMTACVSLPLSYLVALIMMDLYDYNEYIGLPRLEGTTNQLAHGIATQLGQGLGGFLLGVCLDISGFVSASDGSVVTQPDSAIAMIRALYSIIPALLLVILIVCVIFLGKLGRQMPEITKVLTERRAKVATARAEAASVGAGAAADGSGEQS